MGRAKLAASFCGIAGLIIIICNSSTFKDAGAQVVPNGGVSGGVAVGNELQHLSLPFESYDLNLKQLYVIRSAEDVLMQKCLAVHSVEWPLIEQPSGNMSSLNRRRYGVIEREVAQEYGYHVVPDPEVTAANREDLARKGGMTTEELKLAFGVDGVGGCWSDSHESLRRSDSENDYALYNKLTLKLFEESQNSRVVKNSIKRWSGCMQLLGYRYKNPLEAIGDKRWAQLDYPGRGEVAVAVADVKCKGEVGLVAVWQKEERRLQENAIRENAAYFKELKSTMDDNLRTARSILMK